MNDVDSSSTEGSLRFGRMFFKMPTGGHFHVELFFVAALVVRIRLLSCESGRDCLAAVRRVGEDSPRALSRCELSAVSECDA